MVHCSEIPLGNSGLASQCSIGHRSLLTGPTSRILLGGRWKGRKGELQVSGPDIVQPEHGWKQGILPPSAEHVVRVSCVDVQPSEPLPTEGDQHLRADQEACVVADLLEVSHDFWHLAVRLRPRGARLCSPPRLPQDRHLKDQEPHAVRGQRSTGTAQDVKVCPLGINLQHCNILDVVLLQHAVHGDNQHAGAIDIRRDAGLLRLHGLRCPLRPRKHPAFDRRPAANPGCGRENCPKLCQ
mmetsp:Transcript_100392/g.321930  ORF Transcript_100392/g.321930 Transcript_100392/m.321930 type:complete len:240 (-) Transcript_100392:9-728(-)